MCIFSVILFYTIFCKDTTLFSRIYGTYKKLRRKSRAFVYCRKTKSGLTASSPLRYVPVFTAETYLRRVLMAPFSSLDTWAWEMRSILATSIWVLLS